ncbi:tyrosine-type recombinase/integrase [Photobacterium profundum]|uniref:tyrosine-type recombinase/integrase n=1 Tax=Photobacterium profundum TaxID=74109 RepID=UPI003D0D3094
MRDWLAYFEERLAREPRLVREAIPAALTWLTQNASKTLGEVPLPDNALVKVAGGFYRTAATSDALTAYHQVLLLLWEQQVLTNPLLRQPAVWRPLPLDTPTVAQYHLPVGCVERLIADLLRSPIEGKEQDTDEAACGRWLLLVAWESGIESLGTLKAMCQAPLPQWIGLQSPEALTLYLPDEVTRIWLGPIGSALLSYLSPQPIWRTLKRDPQRCIKAWLKRVIQRTVEPWERKLLGSIRVSELVRDIGLLTRSIGLRGVWASYTPLPDSIMVRAFTGHCLPVSATKGHTLSVTPLPALEGAHSSQQEAALHHQFRTCLSDYQRLNPKDNRQKRCYRQTQQQLIALTQQPMSRASLLVLRWLTALFAHGSAWKSKLAASTLLTYHSSLSTFIRTTWDEDAVFELSSEGFTECCQSGLTQFEQTDSQYTVLRFLQFCQQHQGLPILELDELKVLNSQGRVRANYLPPALFDEVCQHFVMNKGRYEHQIVLFMQLCYYAGLREDEALSLHCNEICFDTGMLYITNAKRRKSPHAERKIPLVLLPPFVVKALSDQCDKQWERHAAMSTPLFDDWHYVSLETQFIDFLRQAMNDPTIVTHSLRHSGANNWLVMLSMLAFDFKPPSRPYFLRHALFESLQLEEIRAMLVSLGSPVSLYFPILEWISERIGHAGPATTLTVYLHLLDWLALQLTATSCQLSKREVRRWLSNSNYSFTQQKHVFVSPLIGEEEVVGSMSNRYLGDDYRRSPSLNDCKVGEIVPEVLLSIAIKRLVGCQCFSQVDTPSVTTSVATVLPFSLFALEVRHVSLGTADCNLSPCFLAWLQQSNTSLPSLTVIARQQPAWLRLCQSIESAWPTRTRVALRGLSTLRHYCRTEKSIMAIRVLNRVLYSYRVLGLQGLTLAIHAQDTQSPTASMWHRTITRHGYKVHWVPSESKRVSATVKPFRFAWPLWNDIDAIAGLIIAYEDYCRTSLLISPSMVEELKVSEKKGHEQGVIR